MADDTIPTIPFAADTRLLEAQLNRAVNALNRSMDLMEARATTGERKIAAALNSGALSKFNIPDFGKSLDKAFDSSRLAVIDAGASRLRLFGSALEPLGPLGITAAAGIAAVGIAFDQAVKAADWAEDLERAAKALGLTTTQLQEFDFIAQATGIPVDKMRESLGALAKTIGTVQDSLVRGKSGPQIKVFEAIFGDANAGAVEAQLRALGGVQPVLEKIVAFADKLNDTQRDGIAKALRIDPEVLNGLVEAKTGISDLIGEAHQYGIVVDEDVIRKSAAAAGELHVAKTVIDDELRAAFLNLTPAVVGAADVLLNATTAINNVASGARLAVGHINDLIGALGSIQVPAFFSQIGNITLDAMGAGRSAPSRGGGSADQKHLIATTEDFAKGLLFGPLGPVASIALGELGRQGAPANAARAIGETASGQMPSRTTPTWTPTPTGGGHTHTPADHGPAEIGEAQERYLEALARAATNLNDAHMDRLALIQQRYTDAVAKATTQKGLQPAERQTLIATAGLTRDADVAEETNTYQNAQLDHARVIERAGAEQAQLAEQAATFLRDTADKEMQGQLDMLRSQAEELKAQQDTATARKQRLVIQQQILANERDARDLEIDKQHLSPAQTAADHQANADTYEARVKAAQQTYAGPLSQFARGATSDPGDQLQTTAVQAMDALNSGLAQAIVSGKGLGAALKKAISGAETDLIQFGLKQAEGGLLHLLGFADGGRVSGPGGPRSDGIAARLSPGEYVVNAAAASRHADVLDAINSGRGVAHFADGGLVGRVIAAPRARSGGGGTIHVHVAPHYDMSGNSGDAAIDAKLRASETRTKAEVMDGVRRAVPGWTAQHQGEYR